MTKEQYKREFQGSLRAYPLGKVGYLTLEEEYLKMRVVSYIVARDLRLSMEEVLRVMCEIRGFTGTKIPNLYVAQRKLQLRQGFIDDYNSIQYLKENKRNVMEGMENLIISYIRGV